MATGISEGLASEERSIKQTYHCSTSCAQCVWQGLWMAGSRRSNMKELTEDSYIFTGGEQT